ncbi:shugoshin 1 isoform X1 [Periophthalmus magnuspinnatus]|uniref:shugoshin 1 isoform X1 n=1 Tax=Periophthalmus magnuspinnatus TaxID=409849 RepID=UPI00145BD1F8|nr:shugoshin 1 isoform X1 [Periophthalmus magnuspinnatus]
MAKERVKKKSFQESLEEIKEKMKEKRTKRLASVSAPNRGRSRMTTKCNGTSSTNTILMGVQQNNKALAVALEAEKEKVRQANAVILQLKREQQALFLHLLLLKKKLKDQEALSANFLGNSSNNIVSITTESQRKKPNHNDKSVVETPPQRGSPLCTEGKPAKLPSTVGVRRRQTDRSRRRSDRVQEHKMMRQDSGACLETLTASPICNDDANQKHTHQSEEPVMEEPHEDFQHSTPEPAPAKNAKQPQPARKMQTRTKAEVIQKKPDQGRKVDRGPLKKPWENPKQRARSKSRDRSATRSKTAPAPQNKLNTSLGFNDTFDFDCEEAVHVTPFKAKAEDEEPETAVCKEPAKESPVGSRGKDSLSPSSESEDSLYVPQKKRKKQASPEYTKAMNTRRGRRSKRVSIKNENIPPHKFNVYRDEDFSPKVERCNKEETPEWKSPKQERIYEENQTDSQEANIEEHCLPPVSPLVEAEIKRIDNVLSNFGESSSDISPLLTAQTPQRAKSCKKRGLVVRPAGRGLSLCDVTNLSPAAYRKFQRGGSRLSDVRCSTPAQSLGRKRRCTMTVDYKEPSISAKLRRGDKFTDIEFLHSPIFKQKSGRRSIQKSRSSMKMQLPFEKYNESFVGCR